MSEYERFNDLVGQHLSGVNFVMDYVQIQTGRFGINVFCDLGASRGDEQEIRTGQSGWRDALCDAIDSEIQSVSIHIPDTIAFSTASGIKVVMHVRGSSCDGPAVELCYSNGVLIDEVPFY